MQFLEFEIIIRKRFKFSLKNKLPLTEPQTLLRDAKPCWVNELRRPESGLKMAEKCLTVHLRLDVRLVKTSVTRFGDFLDFGQLSKAFGNNKFDQISFIPRQIL